MQSGAASQQAARGTTAATGRQTSAQLATAQSGRQGQAAAGSGQFQDLNREAQAIQRGTQQTHNYQRQSRSSSAGRMSGGVQRGGGGRRR